MAAISPARGRLPRTRAVGYSAGGPQVKENACIEGLSRPAVFTNIPLMGSFRQPLVRPATVCRNLGIVALVLDVLAACSLAPSADPAEAVQKIHRNGTPHTNSQGVARLAYDPEESFFPIGLYHALVGPHFGRDYDLSVVKDAGFNLIHFWNGQALADVIGPARAAGLQLMVPEPTLDDIRRFRGDPAIWGWYLDEEPSGRYPPDTHSEKLAIFAERRNAIRALDPARPVFSLDKPAMDDGRRANWLRWISASDIAAHFNYPALTSEPLRTLDSARGIPRSVALAVETSAERKPVLLVVQAFASSRGWAWPSSRELRAMIYAGIVHGATGIVYFAYDSFVTRDGEVIGIAPDPVAAHGPTPDFDNDGKPPVAASERDLETSRGLWRDIVGLNAELHALAPVLLSPTAGADYAVAVTGESVSPTPIRVILKEHDGRWTLIAVNLDDAALRVRMTFPLPLGRVGRLFDDEGPPAVTGGIIEDNFAPFAVRLYTIER